MLKQIKNLQNDLLIQLGFTFLIVIPFVLIAVIGYRTSTFQMIDETILKRESTIFIIMTLLTAALVYIILRSFYMARARALLIAEEMTESLRKSEDRYKAFISTSSEGIWRFELEKPVVVSWPAAKQLEHFYKYAYLAECNDVLAKMYGYEKAKDILGVRLTDMLIPTDPKNIEYLTKFVESRYKLIDSESKEKDKNGNIRYFHNTFVGIIEHGHVKSAWGTQRDITKEKEFEQIKDNFILTASHELRTPITSIKGLSVMIITGNFGKVNEPLMKPLKMIESSVDKLNRLTNDILDVLKVDTHKLKLQIQDVDIKAVLKDLTTEFKPIAEVKQVKINLIDFAPISVQTDPQALKEALHNIIENAIKFTPRGKVTIAVGKQTKQIAIAISDTGIGIDTKDQPKIFKRFEQITTETHGKPTGTGLGLYLSKQLINNLGGTIKLAESELGKGTTFVITLPIKQKQESKKTV